MIVIRASGPNDVAQALLLLRRHSCRRFRFCTASPARRCREESRQEWRKRGRQECSRHVPAPIPSRYQVQRLQKYYRTAMVTGLLCCPAAVTTTGT
jgi:hypothetical protein